MQSRNVAFSVFQRSAQVAQAHGCSSVRKVAPPARVIACRAERRSVMHAREALNAKERSDLPRAIVDSDTAASEFGSPHRVRRGAANLHGEREIAGAVMALDGTRNAGALVTIGVTAGAIPVAGACFSGAEEEAT